MAKNNQTAGQTTATAVETQVANATNIKPEVTDVAQATEEPEGSEVLGTNGVLNVRYSNGIQKLQVVGSTATISLNVAIAVAMKAVENTEEEFDLQLLQLENFNKFIIILQAMEWRGQLVPHSEGDAVVDEQGEPVYDDNGEPRYFKKDGVNVMALSARMTPRAKKQLKIWAA